METERQTGAVYRLMVHLDDREPVSVPPIFRSYKAALTHVAVAVRRNTRHGAVRYVALQRGTPADDLPDAALSSASDEPAPRAWTTIDQWGPEVIDRIVGQNGVGAQSYTTPPKRAEKANGTCSKTAIARRPPRTCPDTIASGDPAESTARITRAGGHRSHRWHVGLTVVVVVATWIAGAYLLTGGRLAELFAGLRSSQPTAATELPFERPAEESPSR